MGEPLRVRWAEIVEGQSAYHIARHAQFPKRSTPHAHDFAEVFWVERGRAVHEIGGREQRLLAGDVVVVRPTDIHRYRAPSADFAITNLAFPHRVLTSLQRRYGSSPSLLPDSGEPIRPSSVQFARLLELAAGLGRGPASRLHLDRFLLELLAILEDPEHATDHMPVWLREAIARWQADPRAMKRGVSGLAAFGGRSREHVSRIIRQHTGVRAVDLVNTLRMDAAAGMLRMSDTPITRVAIEVGLPNLSHFYRVFRQRFGTTPRHYRINQRHAVDPTPTTAHR